MNTNKYITTLLSVAIASTASAATDFINIDFQGGGSITDMTGLAVAADTEGGSATWNIYNQNVDGGSLVYSDNTASAVTISLNSSATGTFTHQNAGDSGSNIATNALLKDYAYSASANPSEIDFTFGNVAAGTYDLYVYGGLPFITATQNLTTTVSITGETSQDIAWTAANDAGTFQIGENYVVFSNVTLASLGSITGNLSVAGGEANLSGFQLVSVPEPRAYALIGGLFAMSFCVARRRL